MKCFSVIVLVEHDDLIHWITISVAAPVNMKGVDLDMTTILND